MEAFEGSKDVFKTWREKAQKVGRIVIAEAKKAAGIHVGQVNEANPVYFIVIAYQGAMVRAGIELDSEPVHGLHRGDLVTCVDISGRRARIIDPVEGWISVKTQQNEPILEMTIAPDRDTQISQMERRFEKLKAEKLRATPDTADGPFLHGADQPVAELGGSPSSVAAIKGKVSFKNPTEMNLIVGHRDSNIPKLTGPTLKISKPEHPKGGSLLDLDSPRTLSLPPQESTSSVSSFTKEGISKPWTYPFADLLSQPVGMRPDAGTMNPYSPSIPIPKSGKLISDSEPGNQTSPSIQSKSVNDFDDWFK